MSRLPPLARDELQTDEQRALFDYMDGFSKKQFDESIFTTRQANGAFLGPYAPLLYTPAVARPFFELVAAASRLPGLSLRAREVSILVTGTKYQAAYEVYAHRRNAVHAAGLPQDAVDEICLGDKPAGMGAEENMAYDVTKELLDCAGPLSDSSWAEGVKILGQEGMTALVHFVGAYAYVSMLLNGFDCKVPEGQTIQ